jgi:DNA-binding NarL/FixJ family response regulator
MTHAIEPGPILLVDDDASVRDRLRNLLHSTLAWPLQLLEAGDLRTAHAAADGQRLALALVDIGLPDGSGLELIAALHQAQPDCASLVISAWGDRDVVVAALRAGATGYLLKERDDAELALSLQSLLRGGAPIDPFVARHILQLIPEATPPQPASDADALSERETEVLRLVARGYSNREIAELTSLSRFTIEGYTKNIYRKLAVGSRTAAVFEAKNLGLLH